MNVSTEKIPTESTPLKSGKKQCILNGIFYIFLTLIMTRMVMPTSDMGDADSAYQQAYIYFLLNGFQIGKDYIFTYGPLAHFLVPRYHPELFCLDYGVSLVLGAITAWPLWRMWRVLKGQYGAQLALLLPFFLCIEVGPGPESPFLASSILMVVLLREKCSTSRAAFSLIAIYWAFLSLCKFNLLVLMIGFVGYLTLVYIGQRDWKRALALPLVYFMAIISFWVLAGQDLTNIPSFLLDSWEISKAYAAGMTLDGKEGVFLLAIGSVLGILLCAGIILCSRSLSRTRQFLDAFLIVNLMYILWKMGFTRNNLHEVKFFLPVMIMPFLIRSFPIPSKKQAAVWWSGTILCLVMGLTGYSLSYSYRLVDMLNNLEAKSLSTAFHVLNPVGWEKELQMQWEFSRQRHALPKIHEEVGTHTVDIFSYDQYHLMFEDYNYTPRYVFQGYQACTEPLLRMNGASYWGTGTTTPPEYVVYRERPMDGRFSSLDDSQGLLALLYAYTPLFYERSCVLYKRLPDPPITLPEATSVLKGTLALGEPLILPEYTNEWQMLSLEFIHSPSTRFKGIIKESENFTLRTHIQDGTYEEARLIPEMSGLPFLINPTSAGTRKFQIDEDILNKVIMSIEIVGELGQVDASDWSINYTLTTVPAPPAITESNK